MRCPDHTGSLLVTENMVVLVVRSLPPLPSGDGYYTVVVQLFEPIFTLYTTQWSSSYFEMCLKNRDNRVLTRQP